MKLRQILAVLLSAAVLGGCSSPSPAPRPTGRQGDGYNIHENPVGIQGIGDPFILRASDGKYYMYPTSSNTGFMVWTSDDLSSWSSPQECYRAQENSFGYDSFWAPAVIEHDGKFYMYYTARWKENSSLRIGVAVADSPTGPFEEVYDRPMFDYGYAVIDADVLLDDDGKAYLYYSRDCSENVVDGRHESHIYAVPLSADLLSVEGEPTLLIQPDQEWEFQSGDEYRWNEGPSVIRHGKQYYLIYSANFYADASYSLGYAVSKSPLGPFVKHLDPILEQVPKKVSGPGHNNWFTTPDGRIWIAYHVHTNPFIPSSNRQLFIDELYFEGDRLIIDGPTFAQEEQA